MARPDAVCRISQSLLDTGLGAERPVAILSETQSREVNVRLAELAAHKLRCRAFHVIVPTPPDCNT